ncbi:putative DnaK/Hsp70 [Cafeteria roenbergensis virus]|uniref:Putative DnaK/Hsp70 n=1 Tax=Cafeteria roenbergensis virus (strain BV-PW1) TaxID=693272 RepID=E3T511_CROVB|nr:putative DnaK/Hsp70 [Cafeteria roenbergensis virus BV-PW1]ADO67274.1 putative DnaK/Hsp70 [Cafeteria roenbergensis virus BV-PW1]
MNFGIDFGTTSSSICYFNNTTKKYSLLKKNNYYKIPSQVYQLNDKLFTKPSSNFKNITYFKRQINTLNFNKDTNLELEKIVSFYLKYLKNIINKNYNIGNNITSVFTVPTSYNHYQRSWYKNILQNCGFTVKRIISEPSSAAIAYYHFNPSTITDEDLILVIDLGGGTTDISLLEKDNLFYQVIYNKGNLYLGGDDFTNEMSQKLNLTKEQAEYRKLLNNLDDTIYYQDSLNKLEVLLKEITKDNNDNLNKIKDVILVGNGLKLSGVIQLLENYFPDKLRPSKEQEFLVAYGAGILSNELDNVSSELVIVDSTSLSLGIETVDMNFSIIIPANSPLPASGIRKYLPSDDNEDELKLTIYQGEHSLAEDNEIVGELIIPANPNKYVDSVYQVKLILDLNGIIMIKINDLYDKTYSYDKVLKFEKPSNIEDLQKSIQDNTNDREFRRLKYEIKFISNQIILGLEHTLIDTNEKEEIILQLNSLYTTSTDYPSVIKNHEILNTKFSHLQYSKKDNELEKEDLNDLIRIDKQETDYSDNLTKVYLQDKLRSYLDIEKIINNNELLEIIKNLITNFDNLELMEIQLKIKEIDEALNLSSDFQEFRDLILEIEYELESNNLDLTPEQQKLILERITLEKIYIEEELDTINYKTKMDDFNQFCEVIIT